MAGHVFLSYVHENSPVVDRLGADLVALGLEVWLDRARLTPGQRWRDAIREAIRSGNLFVACFSRQFAERDQTHMHEELTVAIDELRSRPADRTWFIPVRLDDASVPNRSISRVETLHDLQWVDLSSDWIAGVRAIADVAFGERSARSARRQRAKRQREPGSRTSSRASPKDHNHAPRRTLVEELRNSLGGPKRRVQPFAVLSDGIFRVRRAGNVPERLRSLRFQRIRVALIALPEFRGGADALPVIAEALNAALLMHANVICFSETRYAGEDGGQLVEIGRIAFEASKKHDVLIIIGSVSDARTRHHAVRLFHPGSGELIETHADLEEVPRSIPFVEIFQIGIASMTHHDVVDYAAVASVVRCAARVDMLLVPCATRRLERMAEIAKITSEALPGLVALVNATLPEQSGMCQVWYFGKKLELEQKTLSSGASVCWIELDTTQFEEDRINRRSRPNDGDLNWLFGNRDLPTIY